MATIGVLTYTLPPGLKLNTNFVKQTPMHQQTNFNNNSTIITKIEDISMLTSQVTNNGDVLVMRKKQKLNPLQETGNNNQNKINDTSKPPPAKKQKLSGNTINNTPAIGKNVIIPTSLPLNNISNIIQQQPQMTQSTTITPTINKPQSSQIEIKINPIIGGKKSQPLPQAVARRNARERNRVKQVNNGFAALRQRIPDEVAEAFEAAGNGRGTAKKLSKVETLRMAVEYIRSLEKILGIEYTGSISDMMSPLPSDDDTSILMNSNFMSSSTIDTVIKTEYCSSPPTSDDHERFDDNSLYDPDESSVYFSDNLPDVTTINGQQYLRIPGTNTYQLITPEVFENEENIHPLDTSSLISTPSPNINYLDNSISGMVNSQQQHQQQQLGYNLSGGIIHQQQQISPNLINVNNTPALISPDQYSNNSIGMQSSTSPAIITDQHHSRLQQQQQNLLSQMQMHQDQLNRQQNQDELLTIKTEQLRQQHHQTHASTVEVIKMNYNQLAPNSSPLSTNDDENQGYSISSNELQLYDGVMTVKRNIKIENDCNAVSSVLLDNNDTDVTAAAVASLSEESMMEAIDWWEAHTPKSEQGAVM